MITITVAAIPFILSVALGVLLLFCMCADNDCAYIPLIGIFGGFCAYFMVYGVMSAIGVL